MTATENQSDQSALPRETRTGMRLHAFSNMISGTYYSRTEVPFGVALSEWRVLQASIVAPGTSQGEAAMANGLNVMTVSRAVAGLRRKGLIEVKPDPDDRRRSLMFPTDLGREIGADIAIRARIMYGHVFSVLSDDELALIDELMDRVNTFVQSSELPEATPASRDWAGLLAGSSDE